jgi:hypothetical protein
MIVGPTAPFLPINELISQSTGLFSHLIAGKIGSLELAVTEEESRLFC